MNDRLIKLSFLAILMLFGSVLIKAGECPVGDPNDISCWLRMNGEVVELIVDESKPGSIGVKLRLNLSVKNTGNKPVFIFEQNPFIGVQKIARSKEDAEASKYIYWTSFGLANNYGAPEEMEKIRRLDKKTVPRDMFLTLKPSEEWKLTLETRLSFDKAEPKTIRDKSWSEISQQCANWLRVGMRVWDLNLEKDSIKLKFGKKLQERWQEEGFLAMDYLVSEPIRITFPASTNCQ